MHRRLVLGLAATLAMTVAMPAAWAQDTVKIADVAELSGPGATAGVNWNDGVKMAIEEINAAGGILGKQVELSEYDSQSDAQTSRAMVQKAIDDGAYALLGTVYSGSTHRQHAGRAAGRDPAVHRLGERAHHRDGQPVHLPHLLRLAEVDAEDRPVHAGRDGREEGRRSSGSTPSSARPATTSSPPRWRPAASRSSPTSRPRTPRPTSPPTWSKPKGADADAIFVYMTEEESARFLREAKKQGLDKPLVGEMTLIGQKVIDLAGDAADGAIAPRQPDARRPEPERREDVRRLRGASSATAPTTTPSRATSAPTPSSTRPSRSATSTAPRSPSTCTA